jgi:hypothetical protein
MAFRDDREAQLARAEALDRENRRLREELAERERALAEAESDDDAVASDNLRLRQQLAQKEQRERELREALARERGPGLLVRIGRRIAALRLPEPSGDGGYWSAALSTWRLYVPLAIAAAIPALAVGGLTATVLAVAVVATPILAGLLAAIPWLLGRRRRVNGAAAGGIAIGLLASAVCVTANVVAVAAGPGVGQHTVVPSVIAIYAAIPLLLICRGIRAREFPWLVLPFAWLFQLPHPLHLIGVMAFAMWAGRLVDPDYWRD